MTKNAYGLVNNDRRNDVSLVIEVNRIDKGGEETNGSNQLVYFNCYRSIVQVSRDRQNP